MMKLYLYVAVLVSGASVLALEILGTRILGPFYGVSLFLWSALIAVTLLALSVGYAVGGRWADKPGNPSRIYFIIAVAGLWTLFIPVLKYAVLGISEPLGLRFAVLISSLILFAPPLTLLGMVSPFAIRIRAESLKVVGQTAGDLYAISTVGSVAAALLTGFFLIPAIGVASLTFGIGAVLLICGILGWSFSRLPKLQATVIVVLVFPALIWAQNWISPEMTQQGLVAIEQSPYAEIRVVDKAGRRHMLIDGGTHTIVNPETWESYFPYTAVVDLTRDFFDRPGEMLLIGLGGGTVAKNFAKAGWLVDAVEIDPTVVQVAQHYFGFQDSDGSIYAMDGRQFLITHENKYDVIIMDAFGSSSIPFHLVTVESFALVASRLKNDGVLAINIEASSWRDLIVKSFAATLKKSFSKVWVLPAHQNTAELGNMILLASQRELPEPPLRYKADRFEVPPPGFKFDLQYRRDSARRNRFVAETGNVPVLTDDLNPVDLWSEEINLIARKDLHNYFNEGNLSW